MTILTKINNSTSLTCLIDERQLQGLRERVII